MLLIMHGIEYYYPQLVPYTYQSRTARFIDLTSAYLLTVITMYYTIKYIRRNYDVERLKVEEKKQAIEEQNQYKLAQNQQLEHIISKKNTLISLIAHNLRPP